MATYYQTRQALINELDKKIEHARKNDIELSYPQIIMDADKKYGMKSAAIAHLNLLEELGDINLCRQNGKPKEIQPLGKKPSKTKAPDEEQQISNNIEEHITESNNGGHDDYPE